MSTPNEAQVAIGVDESALALDLSPAQSLFLGKILEQNLFPFPAFSAEEKDTLEMVLESVDRFMESYRGEFATWDRKSELPEAYLQAIREMGLFGLIVPDEFDGMGLSNAAYSRVLQQSSRYDSSTSVTVGAHSSIGMKGLLLFGTDEQKARYLPRLASGELIAAFSLTEPGAGSDAASIRTKAVKNDDGSWTLNGEKIWITNGGIANFYTVFARTDGEAGKLSAFIVERDWPGIAVGLKEDKFGIRASSTTSLSLTDVNVPAQNLLGAEGKGFKIAMSILNNGRTGLGGGAVGGMKTCIALAAAQATERQQFGKSIASFGLVKEKIAQMTVDCFAAESVVRMVAHYIDAGCTDYSVEAAISKVYASEAMWRTANEALQIAAGSGYMKELPYEQIVRDSRILTIFEGTSEILRLLIALSGLKGVGEQLQEVKAAADNIFNNPIKGFGLLTGHAGRRLNLATRLGRDTITQLRPELQSEAAVYSKYAAELARTSNTLLQHYGKGIIDQQLALKRVADVTIDLFVGLCVLSRVNSMEPGDSTYDHALAIARMYTQAAKRRMNQSLRRVPDNEDDDIHSVADMIFDRQQYPWDVL